jgi:hypothetical protein
MTSRKPLPCIVCGKELEAVGEWDHAWRQSYGAAEFVSYGHFGSAFDPMDGRISVAVNICDDCLKENRLRIVYITEKTREPEYEYSEFMPWLGE